MNIIAQNLKKPSGEYWGYGVYLMVNRDFYNTSSEETVTRIDNVRTP